MIRRRYELKTSGVKERIHRDLEHFSPARPSQPRFLRMVRVCVRMTLEAMHKRMEVRI